MIKSGKLISTSKKKIRLPSSEKAKLERQAKKTASKVTPKDRALVERFIRMHKLIKAGFGNYRSVKRGPITYIIKYDHQTGKPIIRNLAKERAKAGK